MPSCPPRCVVLTPGEIGAHGLALRLRLGDPAVIARVQDDRVLLDVRTVAEPEIDALAAALGRVEA